MDFIFFISVLMATITGVALGLLFSNLKNKASVATLEERNAQLQQQKEILKNQLFEAKLSAEKNISEANKELKELRNEKDFLNTELTRRNTEFENLMQKNAEQKQEVEKLQEKFQKEFENLANKILDQKSEKFTSLNKENLQNILSPLQEKISNFEKKVEDTHKDSIGRNSQLQEQIRGLKELNEQMSKEATNLTKALKGDSKMQGNWGELVLERVLEKSGLEKDREYFVQQNFTTEEGKRVLPDVVIHLPEQKKMIIDSKVSLTAYERFVNEDNEAERALHLKSHLASLKKHIENLSSKNYHELYEIESPDFVLLFVPIEPAFAIAINSENNLYTWAFEKNIVIVTPTTLLATLRTIDSMWTNEKQRQNAMEIARQAGNLYDKFCGFINDLTNVGKKLDAAKDDYSAAMKKLVEGNGNLINRAEKLKQMGITSKKQIPESIVKRATEANEEPPMLN